MKVPKIIILKIIISKISVFKYSFVSKYSSYLTVTMSIFDPRVKFAIDITLKIK